MSFAITHRVNADLLTLEASQGTVLSHQWSAVDQ